jgi:hypothetical protein
MIRFANHAGNNDVACRDNLRQLEGAHYSKRDDHCSWDSTGWTVHTARLEKSHHASCVLQG